MDAHEVVVHHVKGDGMSVIFDLFAERIGQMIAMMLGLMAASVLDTLEVVPSAAPGLPSTIRAGLLYGASIAAGFIAEEIFQRIRGKAEK